MYVLDVLGLGITVRWRHLGGDDGGVESVVDISEDPGGVLTVQVRGVESTYGEERRS